MNRHERDFEAQGEAKLKFLPGEYHVVIPGEFVTCAVTGRRIALADLKYWSVEHQEAYATPEAAIKRYQDSGMRK